MKAVVKKSSVCVLFATLLIATYPINYPLLLSLRPVDIVLILFAIWSISKLRVKFKPVPILIGVFYIFYLLSTLYGVLFLGVVNLQNFAFIYKYSVLFICIWLVLSSKPEEKQITFLLKLLLFSFIVVIAYEYVSLYTFKIWQPNLASKFRPNFPFTKPFPSESSGYLGDAHLLASYISTGLLAIIFCGQYRLLKIPWFFYCMLLTITFGGMLLTGSRNGVVTFSATLILFGLWMFAKRILDPKNMVIAKRDILRISLVILAGSAIIITFYLKYAAQDEVLNGLLHRAFYFNPSQDQSYLGRIRKLNSAWHLLLSSPVIVGPGLQSSQQPFFDGAIPSLLVSTGLGGLFVFTAIIVTAFLDLHKEAVKNQRQSEFRILFFVSLNYLLANLITEFFLVSRSVVPFAVFWGLIARLIHIPKYPRLVGVNAPPNSLLVKNQASPADHVKSET